MTSSATPATDLTLYGAAWCPDCRRSKAFLAEQRIPFHYVDLEVHPEENATVERYNDGKRIIPTIVFADGSTPTSTIASSGMSRPSAERTVKDSRSAGV